MGVVYLAHDLRLCRPVAIKVLSGDRLDSKYRDRLRAEALALSMMSHPNIATVFDFGAQPGADYLVMEYVAGTTLDSLLVDGPLAPGQVAALGAQLARGVAAAHAAGIIHRDIKPGNLRVTPEGLLKILDFGVAISPAAYDPNRTTQSGVRYLPSLAGTLLYMAPERLRGDPADARSDVYSMGVVLYEMACGCPPFESEQPIRLIDAILHSRPPRVRDMNPAVPRGLEKIIMRALQADPERRYQSANDLAAALENTQTSSAREPVALPAMRSVARWFGRLARLANAES
jgi:serine/threonine-protein kinase